jgi:hypothetical protein
VSCWFRNDRGDIDEHRDGLTRDCKGLDASTLFVAKVLPAQSRTEGVPTRCPRSARSEPDGEAPERSVGGGSAAKIGAFRIEQRHPALVPIASDGFQIPPSPPFLSQARGVFCSQSPRNAYARATGCARRLRRTPGAAKIHLARVISGKGHIPPSCALRRADVLVHSLGPVCATDSERHRPRGGRRFATRRIPRESICGRAVSTCRW